MVGDLASFSIGWRLPAFGGALCFEVLARDLCLAQRPPGFPTCAVWRSQPISRASPAPLPSRNPYPLLPAGGGYHYSLCPASEPLTEECFNRYPLTYTNGTQRLRYLYVNDTSNDTVVQIDAVRVSEGTFPPSSVWTKNPVPAGTFGDAPGGNGNGNLEPPQFPPPTGCDRHCWGYQPCNLYWTHPSWEGWNRTHQQLPPCANAVGEGCCHTAAYMIIEDSVVVPDLPSGDYVVRWRWDVENSPQIWSGCGDIKIAAVNK